MAQTPNHIDPVKYENYLNTLDTSTRQMAEKIVNNSIRISREELLEMVNRSLDRFLQDTPRYNLFVPNAKIGSEHWLICQLKDKLCPIQVLYGYKGIKVNNNYPILIIDDCIYSSVNMCSHIDELQYQSGIKNKFVCVVAATVNKLPQVVRQYGATIIADRIFEHLDVRNLFELFPQGNTEQLQLDKKMNDMFGIECGAAVPVYFHHKIANAFGCYPLFHMITKYPPDRSEIDKITKNNVDDLVKEFKLYTC